MIGNLTIETTFSDPTLLYSILNGVAMVSKETTWIWAFAVMVSLWNIMRSVTASAVASPGGQGGAKLAQGSLNIIMPLVLAMLLTTPALKSSVNIENVRTGKVVRVDNVPDVIAILPAAASTLGTDLKTVMRTAFGTVNPSYSEIGATTEGVLNPLKVLLTSRTAAMRLGSVDSMIRSVVGACIGYDSGSDYSTIIDKVRRAGPVAFGSTISIKGSNSAAISQLLYQASLNTNGFVPDLIVDVNQILTCPGAATLVAQRIEGALDSQQFKSAVLGSLFTDNPTSTGDYSFDRLALQWAAVRKSTAVTNVLAGGTSQATTEVLNLLFDEIVNSNLNCLRSDGPNRTTCQSSAIQALEVERTSVTRAASSAVSQTYAGPFAESMLALVVGLGPILLLFMMFMGTNASKAMYMAAHVTVWPILVANVGNEIINGMIYTHLADFINTLTQGGYLTQPMAIEAYKEFSKQIGVASTIQSSLPVLLSMIFALGASSASVSVANKMNGEGSRTGGISTPEAQSSAPVVKTGSMANIAQGAGGWSKVSETGATNFVQQTQTYGDYSQQLMRAQAQEVARQKNISEGETQTNSILEKSGVSDTNSKGIDRATTNRISDTARESLARDSSTAATSQVGANKQNMNNTTFGAGASATANAGPGSGGAGGKPGFGFGFGGSVRGDSAAQAQDSLSQSEQTRKEEALRKSTAVENAISKELANTARTSQNQSKVKGLEAMLQKQQMYSQTLSETASDRDNSSQSRQAADRLVSFSQNIGSENLAQHANVNQGYQRFLMGEGRQFGQLPAAQQHLDAARELFSSGGTDRLVGSPLAQQAALNHNAAVRLYNDKSASGEDRQAAANYLTGQGLALNGMRPSLDTIDRVQTGRIDRPEDATGVESRNLDSRAPRLDKMPSSDAAQPAAAKRANRPRQETQASAPERPRISIDGTRQELQNANLTRVDDAFKRAADAGLTQEDSKGTARRAGQLVKENVITAVAGGANTKVTLAKDKPQN
jgi:conjugal transfer mating pair stabilization protein TraG